MATLATCAKESMCIGEYIHLRIWHLYCVFGVYVYYAIAGVLTAIMLSYQALIFAFVCLTKAHIDFRNIVCWLFSFRVYFFSRRNSFCEIENAQN